MDRFTSMQAFVAVVETGGFTAAAERVPISRAGVSKHITDLESHLGIRLLNRTTRHTSLTEAGRAYYTRCVQILTDVADSECVATGLSTEPYGMLRINAPMSFGVQQLAPRLHRFRERYPKVEVELNLNDRFIDVIEEGYDIVIRIAQLKDSSLITRQIAPCQHLLCAAPDYLQQHGIPQNPAELAQHACLHYSHLESGREWRLQGPDGEHRIAVRGPLTTNNGDVVCRAACDGMGIALLPDFIVAEPIKTGRLQIILPAYCPAELHIYAVYPSRKYMSVKLRHFIDFLVEEFKQADFIQL